MAITVTPIDNNLTNCFIPVCVENVLSEYLNYKGYEYHYAFAYALDFQFDKAKCHTDRVADGLNIGYCFTDWLEKIYGIRVQEISFASVNKLIEYIDDRLSDEEPVILHMDSYFLPWSTLYNQEHTSHMVIAVEVDRAANSIGIIDTIEKGYYYTVKKDTLKNACEYVWSVYLPDEPEVVDAYQFDMRTRDGKVELIPQRRIEHLKEFTRVFALIFDPDIEFRNKNDLNLMKSEKLVDSIRKNILQINLFCNWLIWRDEQVFQPVIDIYFQVMSKWNILVNLLYKNCLIGWKKSFNTTACDVLKQIIQLEEKARNEFRDSMGSESKEEVNYK